MARAPIPSGDPSLSLMLAVVASSNAPLLLLDGEFTVIAASTSFCRAFQLDPGQVAGHPLFELGAGEWNVPHLRLLLQATAAGGAQAEPYEMILRRRPNGDRSLTVHAEKLSYGDGAPARMIVALVDVTDARANDKFRDDQLRDKEVLLQEIQHRVANSLQILASVLMQSARRISSDEIRVHLHDAHSRVMSIAEMQSQLVVVGSDAVELQAYFAALCESLAASMIQDRKRVSLVVAGDERVVAADISVSLGLIVTELVINAVKHAFPEGRSGAIFVDYRVDGSAWTLSVTDDGVGMPDGPELPRRGLGSSIVQALGRQLDARVEIDKGGPGTRISIVHDPERASADGPGAAATAPSPARV